ncbi:MAG: L-rhamnose mutarotase [Spirochaetes bacterium]|nr:L-rhamnose mutarotase [Spirochaetota bacterium]
MERLALVYRVKPGKKDEYIKAHNEIWPEILKGLKEAGCREMTIFLRGNLLFLYALIDDIAAFTKTREKDPHYHKWNAWMAELLEHPYDAEEPSSFARLDEIWRFEADKV